VISVKSFVVGTSALAFALGAIGISSQVARASENREIPCTVTAVDGAPFSIASCAAAFIPVTKNVKSGDEEPGGLNTGVTVTNSTSKEVKAFQVRFSVKAGGTESSQIGNGDDLAVGATDSASVVTSSGKVRYPSGIKLAYGDLTWLWLPKEWPEAVNATSVRVELWSVTYADGTSWTSPNKPPAY
jgi:hypothetical protein